jgi:hypothetical protein
MNTLQTTLVEEDSLKKEIEHVSALSREKLLEETESCFYSARSSTLQGILRLRRVVEEKVWEGRSSSENEYIIDRLKVSPPTASKLLKILNHYVIEGNLPIERVLRAGQDNLYEAISIATIKEKDKDGNDILREATPEDHLSFAITLTRPQIKLSKNDQEIQKHEPKWVTYCDICKVSKENHE